MVSGERAQFIERVLIVVGIVTAVALTILLIFHTVSIWMIVFAGILFSVALHGLSGWLSSRTGLPMTVSFGIVLVVLIGLIVGAGWFIGPRVASQFSELVQRLPESWQGVVEWLDQYAWGQVLVNNVPTVGQVDGMLAQNAAQFAGRLTGVVSTLLGIVTFITVVLFNGIYMALTRDEHLRSTVRLIPAGDQSRLREVLVETGAYLRLWLASRVVAMFFIGTITGVGLMLLDVPLALTLGVLSGLLSFVPNFGPLLGAVPSLLIALTVGPTEVLYVALLYLGTQAALQYILVPLLLRKMVQLPVIPTITFQLLMGTLVGPMGFVLAAPILAVGYVFVKMLYLGDTLGEQVKMKTGPEASSR